MKKMMREYFVFLDELRESGETKMFGAPSYLRATFGLTKREAMDATFAWMKTFRDGTKNVDERRYAENENSFTTRTPKRRRKPGPRASYNDVDRARQDVDTVNS